MEEFNNEYLQINKIGNTKKNIILITYHISPHPQKIQKIELLGYVIEQLNKKFKEPQIILNGDLNYNIRHEQNPQIT